MGLPSGSSPNHVPSNRVQPLEYHCSGRRFTVIQHAHLVDTERTVNARTASIASGIETLARRHAAFDEDLSSDTDAVISNLADELGVPVDDLAGSQLHSMSQDQEVTRIFTSIRERCRP